MKLQSRFLVWSLFLVAASACSAAEPAATTTASAPEYGAANFQPTRTRPLGFRGDGSGDFPGATPLTEWAEKKNVRWHVTVGDSYSSPVATDSLVFITSEPDLLVAVNRADGTIKWKLATKAVDLPDPKERKAVEEFLTAEGGAGAAAATPLTDGQNVYVLFANGIVRAVGLDGKPKWITYIGSEPTTSYGRATSPVMAAGKLIVHMTELYAFDPDTGKQLWVNKDAKSTYATPAICKIGDTEIVATPDGELVDARDGKTISTGHGHGAYQSPIAKDGVIYYGSNEVRAVRIKADLKTEDLWDGEAMGEIFGSPLLADGRLFVATAAAELFAYDAKAKGTITPVIETRALRENAEAGGSVASYASLARGGKYMFFNTNKGETIVLEATRDAKLVGRNALPEGTGSCPAFLGKEIFIRNGDTLYCIGQ